jgi:hypothetical protein
MGLDSRACTPALVAVAIHMAAETRSYDRASVLMKRALGHGLSPKAFERLTRQVGEELSQTLEDPRPSKEVVVPDVAVVSCDGGRIHTREPGHGPGVHYARWRETKNATFERMSSLEACMKDPCPMLPDTFRQVAHVAKIAEKTAFQVTCPAQKGRPYQGPKRILRTCLSSLACSDEFGVQMEREAQRRRFCEASRKVFIGDGLPWNWTIWRKHFADFTPILDFIHAVQYVYSAAQAWETTDVGRWSRYLELVEAIWQGGVEHVIHRLRSELAERGVKPDEELDEEHPLRPLADAARYLNHNRHRMDYPQYRRQGLPITSAPMESLIKQINHRVKGSEMFWNEPAGAEAILQVRAASLCDDDRLADYLKNRPGHPFVRRCHLSNAA